MKCICEKNKLVHALSIVNRLTSSKIGLPILQNVLLEAKNDGLFIKATNLDSTIEYKLDAKIEDTGSLTVPAKLFLDFLFNSSDELINIKTEDTVFKIESKNHKATLKGLSVEEYPTLPKIDFETTISIPTHIINEAIQLTSFASSNDDSRPVLTGLLWRFKDGNLQVVGTDGFRLSLYKSEVNQKIDSDYIIPSRALIEVQKIMDGAMVDLSFSNSQVMFKSGGISFISRLIDGSYPNFEAIIPKEKGIGVVVSSSDLLKGLRITSVFSRDSAYTTTLRLTGTNLELNSSSPLYGETSNKVTVENPSGSEFQISLNAQYLIDILAILNKDVRLTFIDKKSPIVVSVSDSQNPTYLVMPLKTE